MMSTGGSIVIFLDIDGVLNNTTNEKDIIDCDNVTCLKRLFDDMRPNRPLLVLSSSWREDKKAIQEIHQALCDADICETVYCCTPICDGRLSRVEEIILWLIQHLPAPSILVTNGILSKPKPNPFEVMSNDSNTSSIFEFCETQAKCHKLPPDHVKTDEEQPKQTTLEQADKGQTTEHESHEKHPVNSMLNISQIIAIDDMDLLAGSSPNIQLLQGHVVTTDERKGLTGADVAHALRLITCVPHDQTFTELAQVIWWSKLNLDILAPFLQRITHPIFCQLTQSFSPAESDQTDVSGMGHLIIGGKHDVEITCTEGWNSLTRAQTIQTAARRFLKTQSARSRQRRLCDDCGNVYDELELENSSLNSHNDERKTLQLHEGELIPVTVRKRCGDCMMNHDDKTQNDHSSQEDASDNDFGDLGFDRDFFLKT